MAFFLKIAPRSLSVNAAEGQCSEIAMAMPRRALIGSPKCRTRSKLTHHEAPSGVAYISFHVI